MRKPFNIGDQIICDSTVDPWTIVGKTLSGRFLIQRTRQNPVVEMQDASQWEHYVEPKVGYVNIYPFRDRGSVVSIWPSREIADRVFNTSERIACVKITYKEGQFDD